MPWRRLGPCVQVVIVINIMIALANMIMMMAKIDRAQYRSL